MSFSPTQLKPPADQVRRHVREMWTAVAGAWEQHTDFVERRGRELTAQMLAATAPQPGERALELACGTGDVGLAVAEMVAPGPAIVSDVVAEMAAIAARRAEARGLGNVTARAFGVEDIQADDGSLDVVVCREGLMFAAEPALAVREIARVLSPGGRTAIAVWGPQRLNPWLGVVFDAVSAQIGRTLPPPGMPGPFALADAEGLRRLLADNGLEEVAVRDVPVPLSASSFGVWWSRVATLAGPLAAVLAGLPEAPRTELEQRLRLAVEPFTTDDGRLEFPGLALLATGRRAAISDPQR